MMTDDDTLMFLIPFYGDLSFFSYHDWPLKIILLDSESLKYYISRQDGGD